MFENYNIPLVLFSVCIAFLASYTAVDLALRINSATGRARKFWYVSESIALGVGVWGVYFIGMLAFKLPVFVSYDIFLTFISFLPAVLASMFVLWVMSRSDLRWPMLLLISVIISIGVSSMHYLGMLAMLVGIGVVIVLLSFSIAVIVDSWFADQNMQMVKKFKELNRKLITHVNLLTQAMAEKNQSRLLLKLPMAQ